DRVLLPRGCELAGPEQPQPTEHGVERGTELVRQRRQELVLRSICRFGVSARLALARERLLASALESLAVGDVGERADTAADTLVRIEERRRVAQHRRGHTIIADNIGFPVE